MPYNKDAINALIAENKLTEAFDALKPVFQSKSISKQVFETLNDIVKAAVEKGEISLAVHAALHREGYFGYIHVPESAEWNTIIHAANKAGGFPETPFRSMFLTPSSWGSAPSELNSLALEIYHLFENKNWDIDDHKVKFNAYGRGPQFEKTTPILLRKVESIKGKDFMLGYGEAQGLVPGKWNLNNTASFNFIAANGVVMQFYSDNSEPTIYEYSGDSWEEELSKITSIYPYIRNDAPNWKKVDCRIPKHNEVYIDTLFDSRRLAEEKMPGYRRTVDTKQYYVNKVVTALRDVILPKIKPSPMAATNAETPTDTLIQQPSPYLVAMMRRNNSPIVSNPTITGQNREITEVSGHDVSTTRERCVIM